MYYTISADYGTALLAAIEGEVSGSLRDLYVMIVLVIYKRSCKDYNNQIVLGLFNREVETKVRKLTWH